MKLLLIILLVCIFKLALALDELNEKPGAESGGPIVKTKFGKMKGFYALNKTVEVFFGIPYAKPPVKHLRFKRPERPECWHGTLKAVEHKPSCWFHATPDWLTTFWFGAGDTTQSEDCLYLNIFAPAFAPGHSWPVLFLIHGGGFEIGTSRVYSNYEDIGKTFVRHGIVVVSIQYRLGQLGFASTGNAILPGNLGLWDQNMALKWVSENIGFFGGDPKKITLFGHSAGGGSVSAHTLSPHSQNLFAKAIQLSGSALSNWVQGSRVADETRKLANALGCDTSTSAAIKSCLMNTSAEQMQKRQVEIGPARMEPNPGLYQARFDGGRDGFFPKPLVQLAQKAPPKPTLMSFTKLEYVGFSITTSPPDGMNSTVFDTALKWSELRTYGEPELHRFIREHVAYPERFGDQSETVAQEILDYFKDSNPTELTKHPETFYAYQYNQLCSDLMFGMPPLVEAKLKARNGWPVYMFLSDHINPLAFHEKLRELNVSGLFRTYHAYDFDYVFLNTGLGYTFNEQDRVIQAFMQEAVRNFILTDNPSTKASTPIKWPKVEGDGVDFKHVGIVKPKPVILPRIEMEQRNLAFWLRLGRDFPQYDLLFESKQPMNLQELLPEYLQ